MTTFVPRPPYTSEELDKLYPSGLQLQQVQVILRHGERTPVTPRFRNAGLREYWPYCNAARRLRSVVMTSTDLSENSSGGGDWDVMEWRRRLETFSKADDSPVLSIPGNSKGRPAADSAQTEGICNLGELTDQGRATTLALGQRLRHLYVDQLGFLPGSINSTSFLYLRATPIPRALESMQQAFAGLYPPSERGAGYSPPTIITRTNQDETLFPNDGGCRRFSQLARAFGQRTADRWNDSPEMAHLNARIGRWMPAETPRVAVDGHPRLSGIMDTVNSTLAHPDATRLPNEFYDPAVRATLDRINVEEWYSGYKESKEYRQLGIGGLAADIVQRMVGSAERSDREDGRIKSPLPKVGGDLAVADGADIRFAMSGAHDTTLAALLTALGAFDGEKWPPFTSHVAVELFKKGQQGVAGSTGTPATTTPGLRSAASQQAQPSLWSRLFGGGANATPAPIARRPVTELSEDERARLEGYYVRIRYNDRVLKVPGCAPTGKHLDGDDSFCSLEAFKNVVDGFTPHSWKDACKSNLGAKAFPEKAEPAGW